MPGVARTERAAGRLVVVRHGATAWSRQGRHTGRTDVALEEAGIVAAREVGRRLSGCNFALVLTSPLERARQTCALAGFGERAEVCEDLAEWDYGAYEGLTIQQVQAERPGWSLWRDGVVGGESLDDLARRADRVTALTRRGPGDTLAFAHGHILRVVCCRWIGLPAAQGAHFALEPAAISVLGWERETPAVVRWDDRSGRLLD